MTDLVWMRHLTPKDQDRLAAKVAEYIDRENVFGDHFSEHEMKQIATLLSRPLSPRIENVYCFSNGMVAVTDDHGEQIPEYQGRYEDVWPKIAKDLLPSSKIYR